VSPDDEFELRVEDDGRGFDEDETRNDSGRGIANIRARASMIDADVAWRRRAGGGTVFVLSKNTV
jgi:signal transduction histidine kinase